MYKLNVSSSMEQIYYKNTICLDTLSTDIAIYWWGKCRVGSLNHLVEPDLPRGEPQLLLKTLIFKRFTVWWEPDHFPAWWH